MDDFSLKKNILANYLGQGWAALMGIIFIPSYINYLGIESYGLIGILAIMQSLFVLFDMGMTATLNREMARYTAGAHTVQSIWDLLRSIEVICIVIALLIVLSIFFCSSWLSVHWLQFKTLPAEKVAQAISLMGFVVALRFIESLYRGAIVGLQRQVLLNVAGSILATLRGVGAVCVLVWVAPNIEIFFIWQGLVSVLTIIVFICSVYCYLPSYTQSAKFSWVQLKNIRQFAGGIMASTLLAVLLTQEDKIILSHLLNLEMFGYYTLAGTVVGVLSQLTNPIIQAYYPQFTELVSKKDSVRLIALYHQAAQLISVIVPPAAFMLMFFGEDLLILWTGNVTLAHNVAPIMALLVLGTLLNALMHIPSILTLAYGWPGFAVCQNIIAVLILAPAIWWATACYGAIGAAWIWVLLNSGYVLISAHFMYRRLLQTEKWRWYLHDIIFPALGALNMTIFFWIIQPEFINSFIEGGWLIVSGLCVVFISTMIAPITRRGFIKTAFGAQHV